MKKRLLPFLCLLLSNLLLSAYAQQVDTTMWSPNGPVHTIARSGNTIYLGGSFNYVGPRTGAGAIFDATTGEPAAGPALKISGIVRTVLPDGSGGWYIGGSFNQVLGKRRVNLAHLLPDGRLDEAWNPVTSDGSLNYVSAMVMVGSTLYLGGYFTSVNGQMRFGLAALDATSGQVTAWNPGTNGSIKALAVSGNTIYAGGDFDAVSGLTRNNIAAIDASTGQVTPWNPGAGTSTWDYVSSLASANNTVYVGGSFTSFGGQARKHLAAIDATTGQTKTWNPQASHPVWALAVANNVVYTGGEFSAMNGQFKSYVAALDAASGQLTAWNAVIPEANRSIKSIVVSNNVVYLGGGFTQINGQSRSNVAAVDATTGQLTAWNASVGGMAGTLSVAGGKVFVGGDFTLSNGQQRHKLAALDATTGRLTAWNPDGTSAKAIHVLAAGDGVVYVGGNFSSLNGQSRQNLAALDAATGQVTPWSPNPNGYGINAITVAGQRVFVGGHFSSIGGQARNNLAELNPTTGTATGWNPGMAGQGIYAIAVANNRVYAGGDFRSVAGQYRRNLAALDAATAQLTAWNPETDTTVRALAVAGNTVYVGGDFRSVNGQAKVGLAAVDALTGRLTPWTPGGGSTGVTGLTPHRVANLALSGNILYANGTFASISTGMRRFLAAFHAATGLTTPWAPDEDSNVNALLAYEGVVYAGGHFTRISGREIGWFAAFGRPAPLRNSLTGNIYEDADGDCMRDPGEHPMRNTVVVAQPGAYFAFTDSAGNYTLAVDTGTFAVSQIIAADKTPFVRQVCPTNPTAHTVRFTGAGQTIGGKDFANQVDHRPNLAIGIASSRRRRCMTSVTTVSYCNTGAGAADNVKVYVKLPPYVAPVGANVKYTLDQDNNLVFDVGTLDFDACGTIQITDSVVCNNGNIRGLTQCTRAWITPFNARTPSPDWDGSNTALKSACQNPDRVRLGIYNTGTGSMADSSAYRIYLDAQLAFTRNFKLAKGDSLILQVPANGRTVRLEADQRPGHPTKQSTNVTLEACGTNAAGKVSLGFVAQLPGDDEEPEVAEECLPIIDSYDPNDKAVSPGGVTDQHYTPTRSRLDYVIRFQNTGTDVAYKVVVVDTLSADLDVSTLQVGAVSHPYQMRVSGKGRPVLTFTFHNIMLPDSNANEPKSHGYLQFSIRPKAGLPEKTRIENLADIFFDYNEPIRTNLTFNTLYDLPPVPVEAVQLDGTVVCVPTNTTVTAGTSRTVCAQDTVVLAALQPGQGNGRWQRIGGTAVVTDPENPNARVTGLAYGDNVFEWQVAANTCGSDSLAGRVTITRLRRPATPTITQQGADSLACTVAAGSYQWYLEGSPLGLHTRTIAANRPGQYTVRVTQGTDCHSEPSPAFAWLPTATGPALAERVRVYPNPTTGGFVVVLPPDLGQSVQITLSDAMGRPLAARTLRPGTRGEATVAFDLSARQKGVYLLKLQTDQGVVVRKVCKQ